MTPPSDYKYASRTNGEIVIFHRGKLAKMLKDEPAQAFLASIKDLPAGEDQAVMAETVGTSSLR